MSKQVNIGSSMQIRGDLTGKEDLTIDGKVEGRIFLTGHELTIAENGMVNAEIHEASAVVVLGRMIGNITADDRVEVAATGSMLGDITAPRVVLAEGAQFKGTIDMGRKPSTSGASAGQPTHRPAGAEAVTPKGET
jgi:cytoskeletal protein CcmA (bactofilin family)